MWLPLLHRPPPPPSPPHPTPVPPRRTAEASQRDCPATVCRGQLSPQIQLQPQQNLDDFPSSAKDTVPPCSQARPGAEGVTAVCRALPRQFQDTWAHLLGGSTPEHTPPSFLHSFVKGLRRAVLSQVLGPALHQPNTHPRPGGHCTTHSPSARPSSGAPKLCDHGPSQLQVFNDSQLLPAKRQAPQPGIGGPLWFRAGGPLPPRACLGLLKKEPDPNLFPERPTGSFPIPPPIPPLVHCIPSPGMPSPACLDGPSPCSWTTGRRRRRGRGPWLYLWLREGVRSRRWQPRLCQPELTQLSTCKCFHGLTQ